MSIPEQTASARRTQVAVIVVNYGTADLAAAAVRSVLEQTADRTDVHVHLIDNASPGEDIATLAAIHASENWRGRVTLYAEEENHGFGRGNNVALTAIQDAPPDYVLLLNPDASLTNDAVTILSDFLNEHAHVGCAGAQISKPDSGPVTAAFRFPTAMVEFVSAANIGPITRISGDKTMWLAPDIPTGPVDWVAGAAVMFRWQALQEAGFFDPDFFLYFEEVELMRRLATQGWPCWYVATARVVHHEGASTNVRSGETRPPRRPAYWYNSQRMYFEKTATRPKALARAAARLMGTLLHIAFSAVKLRRPALPEHYLKDYIKIVIVPLISGRAPNRTG